MGIPVHQPGRPKGHRARPDCSGAVDPGELRTQTAGGAVGLMSRILIVEDDPAILCGLRDNLEFESHEVLTAADGEAGYEAVRDHAPELVILDLMLPKLSGY